MTILVVAEHDHQVLNPAVANSVSVAKAIGGEIHLLVAGRDISEVAEQASQLEGVNKVLKADGSALASLLSEDLARQILTIGSHYEHIIFPATTQGKSIAPRVAAKLDVAQISEIVKVLSPDTFQRFIYAGNALATVQSTDPVKVITVRSSAFEPVVMHGGCAVIENIDVIDADERTQLVSRKLVQSGRPELASAKIVVAGGKGLQNKENFEQIMFPLADRLHAAIGATRTAVEMNCAPNDWQLGQTGKVVAPELYIAIGISGAIQHTSGVKDSKVFVAINKDPDAPIFNYADYGLVGDLFTLVPELTKSL